MAHIDIPDSAVDAESPFTALLARVFRDNILHLDHSRQALDSALHATTGHTHHATNTRTTTYNFSDRIEIVAGVNDKINFIYTDATDVSAAEKTATLTAGSRTPTAHAAHVATQMAAAISGGGTLVASFDVTTGSPTRGLFLLQNAATTGTRRFELLNSSGTNAATSALDLMGYAKRDYKKGLGYRSESGSLDGYLIDTIVLGEGGEIDTDGFEDDAFETAKFTNEIIPTGAIQASAVTGAKTANDSIRGDKWGGQFTPAESPVIVAAGGYKDFTFTMTGRGASITPCVVPFLTGTGFEQGELEVTSISSSGGDVYVARITNNSGSDTPSFVYAVAI